MSGSIRVLALQPYYGGSHQQFNDGWASRSEFDWTTLSLPPRHWKWRMRHAGLYFADALTRRMNGGESWDVIVCSDMMNVAEFKGLISEHAARIPLVLYFHENQFAYPNQFTQERDLHFAFTNFVSALAAEQIWFNSRFNLDSMIAELEAQSKSWPDFVPAAAIDSLKSKASVCVPGINSPPISLAASQSRRLANVKQGKPIHLLWAARWEHDKNPADLLAGLDLLSKGKLKFRISVIGQSFREIPTALNQIQERYASSLVQWGYQESRTDYWQALADADVFISTANHEFFGLAAAEAIASGLYPLLPDRLAYPELVGLAKVNIDKKQFFYDGTPQGLADRVFELNRQRISGNWTGSTLLANPLIDRLKWECRARELDASLATVVENNKS